MIAPPLVPRGFRSAARRLVAALLCLVPAASALRASTGTDSILNSPHNLSANGPGTIKAATETEVCVFCHTPHGSVSAGALWNRGSSTATYTPYRSSTSKAAVGQPTGTSKLCLSCHDGTVALGLVHNRGAAIKMRDGVTTLPAGSKTSVATDLSDDHPVSFRYDSALATANGRLKDPALLKTGAVKLDHNGQMQCTSCHNPHSNKFGNFLNVANQGSALCVTCHAQPGWSATGHATSPARWNGQGHNPFATKAALGATTVAGNGCANCHANHAAPGKARLMHNATDDQMCLDCHNGSVAGRNVQSELNKFSVHPIALTRGLHDQAEDPLNAARHVTCVDCHNPHSSSSAKAVAPHAPGALAAVKGVNTGGAVVPAVSREYELCYRCHADSINRGPATVARQSPETNLRLAFSPGNASFHPVAAPGKNPQVPSLLPPYTTASQIYCTDCHNNNQGPGAGGSGPRGPHGSAYSPLLERALATTDYQAENAGTYALCYKCHSRSSILADTSFKGHYLHVVVQQTACTTCHDSHGSARQAGLINFNTTYAKPSANGRLGFAKTGLFAGNCSVTCHGKDHNALPYGPGITARWTSVRPASNGLPAARH